MRGGQYSQKYSMVGKRCAWAQNPLQLAPTSSQDLRTRFFGLLLPTYFCDHRRYSSARNKRKKKRQHHGLVLIGDIISSVQTFPKGQGEEKYRKGRLAMSRRRWHPLRHVQQ